MDQVEFENAVCVAASSKAIRVRLEDRDEEIWIPQSVVSEDSEVWKPGDRGTLIIPEWFALKNGMI